jgi:hypothetical protein
VKVVPPPVLAAGLQAGGKEGQASTIRHTLWALVKNQQVLIQWSVY